MCCVSGCDDLGKSWCVPWEYNGPVSRDSVDAIQGAIDRTDLIIFFNAKRDLHWLRRCGIIESYNLKQRVWDCQVAQFIISNQQEKYPSLDSACSYFGLGVKSNIVETEYWDRGIDTDGVPWDILSEYATRDSNLTFALYKAQLKYLEERPELLQLVRLCCMDTLILAEMEYNGLRFDFEEADRRSKQLQQEITSIERQLKDWVGIEDINLSSNDHLSSILYGGVVKFVRKHPYQHTFKTGPKAGETVTRFEHERVSVTLPRLVEPLPKTELQKEGYWSTDDGVLKRLKPRGRAKQVIELITKRNELERLLSTYYQGFPRIAEEMDWQPGELHGQFNQCVVVTGRLSSSKPNLQNMPPEVDELIKTRF